MYNKESIAEINQYTSVVTLNDDMIVSFDGAGIKNLICDYDVLQEVLSYIDGTRRFYEIENIFLKRYDLEVIQQFLSTLLEENIIVEHKQEQKTNDSKIGNVVVLGDGRAAASLIRTCDSKLLKIRQSTIDSFADSDEAIDFIIIAAPHLDYKKIIHLNKTIVAKNIPFIPFYYNGKKLVLGPLVFPWKTPCLECCITHHVSSINKNSPKRIMDISDLHNLTFSYEIPASFTDVQIDYLSQLIGNEILKITINGAKFEFIQKEYLIEPQQFTFNEGDIKFYEPITSCACCHGMNKKYKPFTQSVVANKRSELTYNNIKYLTAGFRSATEEETYKLIEDSMKNMGLNIRIERAYYENPFESIIPVYHSYLDTNHVNKTPYLLSDQRSHGKGMSEKQAYFSAAFELFERLSANYYGEKEVYVASYDEVKDCCIDLECFSKQLVYRIDGFDTFDKKAPIDWVCGYSVISKKPKLIPASMAFLSAAVFKGHFSSSTSSGLSAGATLEDAILQGLFEVIEHDAWMIGQANPITLPIFDYQTSKNEVLKEKIQDIKKLGYNVMCRDYTNDCGIPVICTWITNPHDYINYASSGFGASLDVEIALERSVTEAIQSNVRFAPTYESKYMSYGIQEILDNTASLYGLYYFQTKDITENKAAKITSVHDYSFDKTKYKTVMDIIDEVYKRIQKPMPNSDIVFFDLSREAFGVKVVRSLIIGDIQRLNIPMTNISNRTFEFQKNMGYSNNTPKYTDLFMGKYPH